MKYTALAPVPLQAGQLVRLTAEQLKRCGHLVAKSDRKGWLEVVVPFQFKAGEAFELDAELPKSMADSAEERGAAAPAPAPAPAVPIEPEQASLPDAQQG